jgi:hypothetical protein
MLHSSANGTSKAAPNTASVHVAIDFPQVTVATTAATSAEASKSQTCLLLSTLPYPSGHGKNGATRCASPKVSQARPGDISCYSNPRVGTGIWIHCSRYFSTSQCLSMSSAPHKRDTDGLDHIDFDPNHPGFIDEEEAALPPISFHGLDGKLISEDEYNRTSELERAHELNGTLHLLYPDHYPHDYMDWYGLLTDNSTMAEDTEDASHAVDSSALPTSPTAADRNEATIERLQT